MERQLRILKRWGQMPSAPAQRSAPELLELCDRMGLLVQVESFDMWERRNHLHMRNTSMMARARPYGSAVAWTATTPRLHVEYWQRGVGAMEPSDAHRLDLQRPTDLNAGMPIDPTLLPTRH